ncbi:MAG TPA: ribosome-associated translation inhibitor RaiA [Thermoanaerobaculia bacterium]|nr:ribosome-associated translation inhibitor RaiA [Thermoanaerobaculia bacterium]
MNIDYVGRHYQPDDKIRGYTEDKLQKVLKFLDEPIEVRITFGSEKHRHIAELHVAHRHGVLQAAEQHDHMTDAVNLAVDKLEKQARRSKNKAIDKRRRANRALEEELHWPVNVIEGGSLGVGVEPRVIKSSRLDIKPMTVEEAALALGDSKNEFIVFLESGSHRVHVLYRRRDHNFGLISPEVG